MCNLKVESPVMEYLAKKLFTKAFNLLMLVHIRRIDYWCGKITPKEQNWGYLQPCGKK